MKSRTIANTFCGLFSAVFWSFISLPYVHGDQSLEETFTKAYENRVWGTDPKGYGTSGSGATLETTIEFREYLQNFLKEHQIRSVIDFGCGDWVWAYAIDWECVEYYGYDVVKSLIDRNTLMFSSSTVNFIHADALSVELPEADLLICKDVLQHLSNQDIHLFISKLNKFKYCIIQNDIYSDVPAVNSQLNTDIARGEGRPLDLSKPPFSILGRKVMTYWENGGNNVKRILLITNHL